MAWRGSVQSLCELLLQDNLAVLHEAFAQEKQNWIELVGWALELQVKIVYDCLKCQLYCPVMQSETIAITISRLTMHCWTPRTPVTRKDRRPTGIPNERHRHRKNFAQEYTNPIQLSKRCDVRRSSNVRMPLQPYLLKQGFWHTWPWRSTDPKWSQDQTWSSSISSQIMEPSVQVIPVIPFNCGLLSLLQKKVGSVKTIISPAPCVAPSSLASISIGIIRQPGNPWHGTRWKG